MSDERKTPAQIEEELARLRQEVAGLRAAQAAEKKSRPVESMPGDYDLLFETLAEALLVVRVRDGLILRINPHCRQLLGLGDDELAGKTLYDFLPEAARARAEARMREAAAGNRLIPQHEAVYRRPDGTAVAIEVGGAILGDGPDAAALLYLTDLTDRKKVEESLRASETELQAVQDAMADALVIVDIETQQLVRLNPAAYRMFGYAPGELEGFLVHAIHPPEDVEFTNSQFRNRQRGIFNPVSEIRCLRKDGTVFTADMTTAPIPIRGRRCTMGVFRDITERKKAEEALRHSEANYRAIFNAANDFIWIYDLATGKILDANESMCRAFGYSREEVRGLTLRDISASEGEPTAEQAAENYKRFIRDGRLGPFEWLAKDRQGRKFWGEVSLKVVNLQGEDRALAVVRDISERKKAEEALRNSEENYRLLFESNISGIAITVDGRIVRANKALCDIHRLSPEAITGMSPLDFVAPQHREELRGKQEALDRGEIAMYSGNFRIVRGDGTAGWVEVRTGPMTWEGKPARLAIVQDVTERVRLENDLREVQKMEAVGQLAGGIAHDFNNLLTGILCSAQLLKTGPGVPKGVYETADVIEKAARRAAELTSQLLGFARRGKHQDIPVDLGATIRTVIRLMGGAIDPHITVEALLPPAPVWVHGDPAQMEQVLLNLAMNARDAMSGGGRLTFAAEPADLDAAACAGRPGARPGRYIVLRVSDTGCGIQEEVRDRIFEPFFTTKPAGKGTGMGLAMVYGIARNHGGWVEVDSAVGKGTTFRVYLPAAAGETPQGAGRGEGGAAKKGRRPRAAAGKSAAGKRPAAGKRADRTPAPYVLVVDDDEMVRKSLTRMLASLGYSVVTAANGREAVTTYGMFGSSVGVVIIDMAMPDLDGRECFLALHRLNPQVKAILCTGGPADAAARDLVGKGLVDFLQKPYRAEQLAAAIAKALVTSRGGAPGTAAGPGV
jgi:PAS domain S-box-containing protein